MCLYCMCVHSIIIKRTQSELITKQLVTFGINQSCLYFFVFLLLLLPLWQSCLFILMLQSSGHKFEKKKKILPVSTINSGKYTAPTSYYVQYVQEHSLYKM